MALRFIDSAAHYNGTSILRKWTAAQVSVVSTGGRRNAPFLSGNGVSKTLTQTSHWFIGAAFLTANGAQQLQGCSNNGIPVAFLTLNTDSTLSVFCNNNSIYTSTLAVSDPSSWHYYETEFAISGGSSANTTLTGKLYVDSDLWGTFSGTGNLQVSNYINQLPTANQVGWGSVQSVAMMDFYAFDNNATDINGLASTCTTNIGDVEIDALFPAADVTTQWGTFGGDGTHAYSCVNETAPDDDTSYVTTTATGSTEAFTYQSISTFTGTILGAQYLVCAKKDVEGVREIGLYVGGTNVKTSNFLSGTNFLSDYYIYYIAPLDSDNGTAWTVANYDAETFGVELLG